MSRLKSSLSVYQTCPKQIFTRAQKLGDLILKMCITCVAIKKRGRIGKPDKRGREIVANVRQNIRYEFDAHVSHIFLFVPLINNPRIHGPIISLNTPMKHNENWPKMYLKYIYKSLPNLSKLVLFIKC